MSYGIQAISRSGSGNFTISQVASQSLDNGFTDYKIGHSGTVYDSYCTILEAMGMLNFSSVQLKKVLDNIAMAGCAFAAATPLNVFFQKRAANAVYTANANERISIAPAFAVPLRLPLSQSQPAQIEVGIHVLGDGTSEPISTASITDAAMLTLLGDTALILPAECFTLGPVKVGSTYLDLIQDVNIDFGIEVHKPMGDGHTRPTRAHIRKIRPMITLTGLRIDEARLFWSKPLTPTDATLTARLMTADSDGNDDGSFVDDTTILLHARKKANHGGNVAAATAEHIKFTITRWSAKVTQVSGDDADDARYNVEIACLYDGTNLPLIINTASTIA